MVISPQARLNFTIDTTSMHLTSSKTDQSSTQPISLNLNIGSIAPRIPPPPIPYLTEVISHAQKSRINHSSKPPAVHTTPPKLSKWTAPGLPAS